MSITVRELAEECQEAIDKGYGDVQVTIENLNIERGYLLSHLRCIEEDDNGNRKISL